MNDNKNWKQLIIAGLIGAVFTGASQYFILQAQYLSDLEKAKVSAKRELLISELDERKNSYKKIRNDFIKYFQSKNKEDRKALLISIRGNVPFFSPQHPTQQRIDSATQSAELWIEQANKQKMHESLEELEKAFQEDLNRIQKIIDEL